MSPPSCHDEGAASPHEAIPHIALIGSPNAGKSSIFNHLTGLNVRTGNYPGVTIKRTVGSLQTEAGPVAVEDVPGLYSMDAVSPDEDVVIDLLAGRLPGARRPDALCVVVDGTTLERGMTLIAGALQVGLPALVVVTMVDEVRARGGHLDVAAFGDAIGVDVLEVNGTSSEGIETLRELLGQPQRWPRPVVCPPVHEQEVAAWSASVLRRASYRVCRPDTRTQAIDRVVLHPLWGGLAFLAVMFAFFQFITVLAAPLTHLLTTGIGALAQWAKDAIGVLWLADLVADGIISGVGAVLAFVPQIALLFLVLSWLEGVGYLARAAYIMDRIMALTGLDGRAFVAMLSSLACTVPGILATRTIPSSRDRITTMLAAPLMTCSARLPVYVLLVGLLVDADATWGVFSRQGLVLFALYLAGGLSAMVAARVVHACVARGRQLPFALELPPYRMPTLGWLLRSTWRPVATFIRKAGTVILVATVAVWMLLQVPTRSAETAGMDTAQAQRYVASHSVAAGIGKTIEPALAPLGFDWRIDVALLGSLSSREVFVSTMGQLAAAQDPTDPRESLQQLRYTDEKRAGQLIFTPPTVIALLVWFIFALQCASTVIVMRRETASWRWPAIAVSYSFALAWVFAFLAHRIATAVVG